MSSHAVTYAALHLHRSRIFFLTTITQHVETMAILREVGRAVAGLAALAAWAGVVVLCA
jgi:hypothetical protein